MHHRHFALDCAGPQKVDKGGARVVPCDGDSLIPKVPYFNTFWVENGASTRYSLSNEFHKPEPSEPTEFSVMEIENPNSVLNLCSEIPSFLAAVERVQNEAPELLDEDFSILKKKAMPTLTLSRLRQTFWHEYEEAISRGRKMKLAKVVGGVCTDTYIKVQVFPNNNKMAYLLSPPTDYLVTVKEALNAGLDTLREIVSANVIRKDGTLDTKAADTIIKAVALLDMRVKGAIVQKTVVDQRSLSVHVNQEHKQLPRSVEELDRELDEVKRKLLGSVTNVSLPSRPQEIERTVQTLDVLPQRFGVQSGD